MLGVEYEWEEAPAVAQVPAVDLSRIALPGDLYARLHQAVRLYSVTDVKALLDEVQTLGREEQRLAAHLRSLVETYDMKAILTLIEGIPHG